MKPYTPNTRAGRKAGGHRIHHRTADNPKGYANAVAKSMRHAARQEGRRQASDAGEYATPTAGIPDTTQDGRA